MNNQSDFGYATDVASMVCVACGATYLNCCNGDGVRYTHKIVGEDGFVAGFYSAEEAAEELHCLRMDRDTAHSPYEMRAIK